MPDFRIDFRADRMLPWGWVVYNPQVVEMTLHCGGKNYETPAAALEYMEFNPRG